MHTPEVAKAILDKRFKSRGFLNALRRAWDLKADEGELRELISLFDTWTGDRGDDLVLSLGDYLWSVVPGMTETLWKKLEHSAVKEGIFNKGGYMNVREYLMEEAIQKVRQKVREEVRQKVREEVRQEVRQKVREEVRQEAWKEGRQEGRQEGMQTRDKEIVSNMLKEKADMSFICKVTGLAEEEIKKLKNGSCSK